MIWALVLIPIVVGFGLFAFPRRAEGAAKWTAVLAAGVTLALTFAAGNAPDETGSWLQRPFVATFHVGLGSGISYWLVLLTALATACALIGMQVPRQRSFAAQMLLLQGTMTGLFVARDLLLFALFWDLMLIPVFLVMIGRSASPTSAWKYLIYNVSGGLALLLATAAYGIVAGTTDVLASTTPPVLAATAAPWIFAGFALAFAVKTPIWPLHTWMPETYADLPSPMAATVAAIQSKAGLYGFIVVGLGVFGDRMHAVAPLFIVLGAIGLVYGALVALIEDDIKLVIAYSSLSHLGLIVIAVFSFDPVALGGAVVYIVAHGLFTAALFIVAGQLEAREETRLLSRLGGLGARNPRLAGAFTIAALAALGLPGLCGFAGELLIITGLLRTGAVWPTIVALIAIVLAAAYFLRAFQVAMQGPERRDVPQRPDMGFVEGLALAPLVVAIVLLGIDPAPVMGSTKPLATFAQVSPPIQRVGEVRR
ncbi:MAG: NADH-quinone oxidoreductase subunit M [Candidatus Baltobacteraceae bacterium]